MKKNHFRSIFYSLFSILLFIPFFSSAASTYLPTDISSAYLPTVKIHTFTLDYDGNLVADSLGSGTLIDDNGTILTNNHVIEDYYDSTKPYDAFQICLTKANDIENPVCEFSASVIERNVDLDLALLKMDPTDARGNQISFNFYLPYINSTVPATGDKLTVLGYPDIGGKTLTVTEGIISGSLDIDSISYLKTDAKISFGNSGGTAIDANGNLVGIPTYVNSSYSSETLGYFLPITEASTWITDNIKLDPQVNKIANEKLISLMQTYINANEKGFYQNDYPPYQISIINGWETGNSLEGAFDDQSSYSSGYSNSVTIFPNKYEENSIIYVSIATTSYGYDVTLDDVMKYREDQSSLSSSYDEYKYEKTKLNEKYDAVIETKSLEFWTLGKISSITYYIPYGDKVISLAYEYSTADEKKLDDVKKIIASFEVDMSKINYTPIYTLTNKNPYIKVNLPQDLKNEIYLNDATFEWDGVMYFGANFVKKLDSNFYLEMYLSSYEDEKYKNDFDLFKKDTIKSLDSYLSASYYSFISKGALKIDGLKGFYYTYEYDYYNDSSTASYTTNIYINLSSDSYLSITYSDKIEEFATNITKVQNILKALQFENKGTGMYIVPDFSKAKGQTLTDIENYVYEENIKELAQNSVFGATIPEKFAPTANLTRKDFIIWAVKSLTGDKGEKVKTFEKNYMGCKENCFEDINYTDGDSAYIAFAQEEKAISGTEINDKKYLYPENQISLTAAFKIALTLYKYEIWQAPSLIPWYIPYLQIAYKFELMPYGVDDINYALTRGEGSYIIDKIFQLDTVSDDYDYDY
ncbi:MAG: peptidase domain-containing protein [Candidatus Peregrinibacteria bacterium GW2011_GWF2_33_10]|nr:MAG: peptidase domain-containing protein [Candidatus Peregrinibacteria bacterium GW2011_GWF2_33_10]OGJ45631.1 MAG: hypothetical protein A2263_00840 [Candidatus Peregrinibacteria bacterium RIFOXYA2_FULL_33_21]OGJ46572.1 MAG: hypothetical protein A2272_06465 [Candidatus Peregrinibacteria bacterium RIFOXYA12_FULL_33_12]OGJ51222.1 MAG: hypothetical protein A2307_01220 [Candidatus Peregrinibacteria bacterium RIFOXYB2_FULL_33_20]